MSLHGSATTPALPGVGGWLVVAGGGMLAAALISMPAGSPERTTIVALAVGSLSARIVWRDLRSFTIPDAAVLALALIALAWRWSAATRIGDPILTTGLTLALDAGLPGGALLAFREIYFRRKGFDGLGFGDVKLAAVGGLLLGAVGFSWALFAASLLGLAVVGATRLSPKSRDKALASSNKIAFGAFLAPVVWAVWVAQQMPG